MIADRYRRTGAVLAGCALLLAAGTVLAATPQTIVLDGTNDFLLDNRLDQDGGDTQYTEIDIGDFYVTNDAVKLYVGFDHDPGTWGIVQLGIAIDVGTADGGTADPWGRQLEWSLATNKPDYMFYVNLDNNWQAGYRWNTGTAAWDPLVTAGPNALGWVTNTAFKELGVLLSTLGVSSGSPVNIEAWTTQDSPTKGPLDLVAGDANQLSTPTFTQWDVSFPIPVYDFLPYTVQASSDFDPPTVSDIDTDDFPAESFFDVYFDEPVDQTTAEIAGNYALSGAGAVTITSAVRDAVNQYIVHLTTSAPLPPAVTLYEITVTGVQDLAGNTIVDNGTTNVACFALKHALFIGRMSEYLATNSSPPDGFSVEGDLKPLTFDPICDTGIMTDTGVDSIWTYETTFLLPGDCGAGTATADLQWKFNHNCGTWEPLASNRMHTFDMATGPVDTLDAWWNDEDPSQFTTHDIDVEFFVDMNVYGFAPTDTIAINGSEPPLTFDVPSLNELADDGLDPDVTAGDGIYSTRLRFPAGAHKDVTYKFLQNSEYECFGQGDRTLYLNDEMYDVVGGTLGPLTLPVVHYDRCTTTWRDVEVVFTCDFNNTAFEGVGPGDVVSVNGTPSNVDPPVLNWDIPSLNDMHDDGAYPDAAAGDKIYSISIVLPDSSQINTEYKYLFNDVYECIGTPNRTFTVDADNHDASGNPQLLPLDQFQHCNLTDIVTIPSPVRVDQNMPNPFNPYTIISFDVGRAGNGSLRVYNLKGELIRTLREGRFEAGSGQVVWDGRTDGGKQAGSGVYLYRLEVGGKVDMKKMMLVK